MPLTYLARGGVRRVGVTGLDEAGTLGASAMEENGRVSINEYDIQKVT